MRTEITKGAVTVANRTNPPPARTNGQKDISGKYAINRFVVVAVSAGLALSLAVITIVATLAAPLHPVQAHATATLVPPTATPTLVPTATLPAIAPPAIGASAPTPANFEGYVFDPLTGRVLLARNSASPVPMASTTKIMTAVVAILFGNPNQTITVPHAVLSIESDASRMFIYPGEKYTLHDLLYGLLLPSGDDAAIAIADGLFGSQAACIAKMNAVAQWLQLTHTQYIDVSGLTQVPDYNYTSAADLAHLAQFAMSLPLFRQIVATPVDNIPQTAQHGPHHLVNTNILLQDAPNLGIDGVKTGFTGAAGHCLVLDARRNGHEIIAVVLGEGFDNARFIDGAALVAWAFREEGQSVSSPSLTLTPLPTPGG
jgi:D-alanyl-D-alanine carboxypeptidase (penicillin-binding protein 5/6)